MGTELRAQCDAARESDNPGMAAGDESGFLNSGTARRAPTGDTVGIDGSDVGIIEQFGKPINGSLPTIIRAFKSTVSKQIHETDGKFKWQRDYYERIIRDEKSLFVIRKYIHENPENWKNDTDAFIFSE
jgi:hypothetical protein